VGGSSISLVHRLTSATALMPVRVICFANAYVWLRVFCLGGDEGCRMEEGAFSTATV
jgi:hypothetical protein